MLIGTKDRCDHSKDLLNNIQRNAIYIVVILEGDIVSNKEYGQAYIGYMHQLLMLTIEPWGSSWVFEEATLSKT